jgi:hypothetical protein
MGMLAVPFIQFLRQQNILDVKNEPKTGKMINYYLLFCRGTKKSAFFSKMMTDTKGCHFGNIKNAARYSTLTTQQ